MSHQDIEVSDAADRVRLIRLNRPKARNALRTQTLMEIADALAEASSDAAVGAVVVAGDAKAFAAGADIREMADLGAVGVWRNERPKQWRRINSFDKPLVGAVDGYCLGAGCELAMVCDVLIAADNAKFGQPEINLGIIPGAGGTQRLIRAVGKSFAMQMVLTGGWIDAGTAERKGLVSEVTEPEQALSRALEIAGDIAAKPPLAVAAAKRALNNAFETHLGVGLELEQQNLALLSGTDDRNEGIDAFMNKRQPTFKGS